jgi:UDP-glucose 4-epimerase
MSAAPATSRVLVLGGLGFIGANLCRRLLREKRRVTVFARSVAANDERARTLTAAGAIVVEGDLRDAAAIASAIIDQDVVVNLAGESGAVKSMEAPIADLDGNCRTNLILLEAMRAHNPVAKLVFVGSRLQYGKPSTLPVHEDHPRHAMNVHAVHKNTVEEYLRVYGELFGLRYTIARVTNPYGPGQPAARVAYGVVNRMIHLALADRPVPIYGEGLQRRDYIFVDDVAAAVMRLADDPASDARAFNVGSGQGTALIDMARTIIGIAGGGHIEQVPWPKLAEQIETGDFIADISRIEREMGWRPAITLRDGIEQTVAFHRAQLPS